MLEQPYFTELIDRELEFVPVEQEDLQSISFYAWLKARILKRRYYEVLLELTAGRIPQTQPIAPALK